MTETSAFSKLLSTPMGDAKKPKPKPEGTYQFLITGFERGQSAKKKTDFIEFGLQFVQAAEDVNGADLLAALQGKELSDARTTTQFYITGDALYRLQEFLLLVLGEASKGRPMSQLIPECSNRTVWGLVHHEPNERDPESPYMRVDKFIAR